MNSPQSLHSVQSYDEVSQSFICIEEGTSDLYLGAMWISNPLTGISQQGVDAIISALSARFDTDSFVQFATLATPDIDDKIDAFEKNKHTSQGLIKELVARKSKLYKEGAHTPLVRVSGVKLHRKRVFITLKCKTKSLEEYDLKKFFEKSQAFAFGLKSANFNIERVDHRGYLAMARQLTHIYNKADMRYEESATIAEQIYYVGDSIEASQKTLAFNTGADDGDNYLSKALSVKFYPEETNLAIMNYLIGDPRGLTNQMTDPFYMALTIYYPDQDKVISKVKTKSTLINQQTWGNMGKIIPTIGYKKRGIDVLVNEMASTSATLVEVNFTVWLFAKTEHQVAERAEAMRAYYRSLGFDVKDDSYILDALWAVSFPLNTTVAGISQLRRFHTMATTHAAQFLPLFGERTGTESPTIPLIARRGEIGGIDFYTSSTNYNFIISAGSGAGKSALAQDIIVNYLAEGAQFWVIDSGGSYKKLALAIQAGGDLDVTYLEFDPLKPVCINPFSAFLESHGGASKSIDEEMDSLVSVFEKMVTQRDLISDTARSKLEQAIRAVFNTEGGNSSVSLVAQYLQNQSGDSVSLDLAAKLESFSSGQYRQWFNGEANIDLNADLVVLELDNLKNQPRLQAVVLTMLMQRINHQMYMTRGRKKILIVDEAWSLLDDPVMVRNFEVAFRTARKHDAAIGVISQGIGDLYRSENSKAMIDNAAWKIILQQETTAIDDAIASKRLNLEEYAQQLLRGVHTSRGQYSELMVINNEDWAIYRLLLDEFTRVVYSTTGAERTVIFDAIDQGKDIVETIEKFIIGDQSWEALEILKQQVLHTIETSNNPYEIKKLITELL